MPIWIDSLTMKLNVAFLQNCITKPFFQEILVISIPEDQEPISNISIIFENSQVKDYLKFYSRCDKKKSIP